MLIFSKGDLLRATGPATPIHTTQHIDFSDSFANYRDPFSADASCTSEDLTNTTISNLSMTSFDPLEWGGGSSNTTDAIDPGLINLNVSLFDDDVGPSEQQSFFADSHLNISGQRTPISHVQTLPSRGSAGVDRHDISMSASSTSWLDLALPQTGSDDLLKLHEPLTIAACDLAITM